MASPTFFGEGHTPRVTDTRWRILQKILGATIDNGGGSTTTFGGAYWEDAGPLPSGPPPDQSKVWNVTFRDGAVSKTWDPLNLAWA
jgi:hypothetical protein